MCRCGHLKEYILSIKTNISMGFKYLCGFQISLWVSRTADYTAAFFTIRSQYNLWPFFVTDQGPHRWIWWCWWTPECSECFYKELNRGPWVEPWRVLQFIWLSFPSVWFLTHKTSLVPQVRWHSHDERGTQELNILRPWSENIFVLPHHQVLCWTQYRCVQMLWGYACSRLRRQHAI